MRVPELNILMAVRNCELFLGQAIESLMAQTFRDWEMIVVDDASSDSTSSLIHSYTLRDCRIRSVRNAEQRRLPASLNRGLSLCNAAIIARADADDVYQPNRLEAQWKYLSAHPEVGVLGANCVHIDSENHVIGRTVHPLDDADIRFELPFGNRIHHPIVMFRKELVLSVGGYDERLWTAQDYALWAQLLSRTRFANLADYLWSYRIHSGSISQSRERIAKHDGLKLPIHQRLFSSYLGVSLGESEAEALLSLATACRSMQENQIAVALPLCWRYLRCCEERESPEIYKKFRLKLMLAFLAQAYFPLKCAKRMRLSLVHAAFRISALGLLSSAGIRALTCLAFPDSLTSWLRRRTVL